MSAGMERGSRARSSPLAPYGIPTPQGRSGMHCGPGKRTERSEGGDPKPTEGVDQVIDPISATSTVSRNATVSTTTIGPSSARLAAR